MKLQEVAQIVDCEHKTAPSTPNGQYFAVGTPAMRGNSINYAQARPISAETFQEWTRRLKPKAGDILFAREAPVGPVVQIPAKENVAPGQRTVLIRPGENVHGDYLFYILTTPWMQRHVNAVAAGSTVPHLNVSDIRSLPLGELPDLDAQRSVSSVLRSLDDKIAANNDVVQRAKALATALVRMNSEGSSRNLLRDVTTLISRGVTPRYDDAGGYVVLNQKCIRNSQVNITPSRTMKTLPKNNEKILRRNDVLVNSTGQGTLGRIARWISSEIDVSVDTHISIVRFNPELADPAFAGTVLATMERRVEDLAEGSTGQTELKRDLLGSLDLNLPPLDVQRQVGHLIMLLDDVCQARVEENASLAKTRDELLPLLMNGKISVREAEQEAATAGAELLGEENEV